MEDYGSIIWLLVAVGAMIFSANSKARKKAREAADKALKELQKSAPRHEAWPSWDIPEDSTQAPASEEVGDRMSADKASAGPQHASRETLSRAGYDTVTQELTPGQTASVEATPHREMVVAGQSPVGAGRSMHAPKARAERPTNPAATPQTEPSDFTSELRENFDLKRAVVYAEILKPKFEEFE